MPKTLFELDQDSQANVYNYFEKTKTEVDNNIEHIRKWLQSQSHLSEIMGNVSFSYELLKFSFHFR